MTNCAVPGCSSRKLQGYRTTGVVFHSFPKLAHRRQKWVEVINRTDEINFKYATVCSLHFGAEDYERDLQHELLGLESRKRRKLVDGAIPTHNLAPQDVPQESLLNDIRNTKVKRKRASKGCLGMQLDDCQGYDEVTELKIEIERWKNECEKMQSAVSKLKNELESRTRENADLRVELSRAKVRASYQIDDQRSCGGALIKVYTSQQMSSVIDNECSRPWEPEIILGH